MRKMQISFILCIYWTSYAIFSMTSVYKLLLELAIYQLSGMFLFDRLKLISSGFSNALFRTSWYYAILLDCLMK